MIDLQAFVGEHLRSLSPEFQDQRLIMGEITKGMAVSTKSKAYAINDTIDDSDRRHVDNCKKCKATETLDPTCPSAKRRIDMAADLARF